MRVKLLKLAHARSGDKGDTANVGLIALREEFYEVLAREVTAERVKEHFRGIVHGGVGSLVAFIIGVRARRLIRRADFEVSGIRMAWWCIVVGALGLLTITPYVITLLLAAKK